MEKYYANERGVLILIALLKEHGIRRIIASPGTTNLSFVASLQCDPFFEMFSCVDERSAAYMACGLAAETGEPVVITCTGATASRNYFSALTEAYYRKLPILVITGTQHIDRVGNLYAQVIDRSQQPKDTVGLSVQIPFTPENSLEEKYTELKINKAINELRRNGGTPVHINLRTTYTRDFSVKNLPKVQKIERIGYDTLEKMPQLPEGRIGIFVGSHNTFSKELTAAVDSFCASHNAVVFCDHTSGYYGAYKVNFSLVAYQENCKYELCDLDLCIHIGEVSAEYACLGNLRKKTVWRVSPDGEIRDLFQKLRYLFAMTEEDFFRYYSVEGCSPETTYLDACRLTYNRVLSKMPELPFSNIWMAHKTLPHIPKGSALHLGILNSTRSWNLFELPEGVTAFANVGGFGIDGGVSSLIGASFANPEKLYFGVVGDLAFFYDMNALGNRHIRSNIRLLVVNNGKGTEFRNFYHNGSLFGDEADKYIAAGGHFGNKSATLVRDFAISLGFEYMSAHNKDEYLENMERFTSEVIGERPVLFETFTNNQDESDALYAVWHIEADVKGLSVGLKQKAIGGVRTVLGKKGIAVVKMILRK